MENEIVNIASFEFDTSKLEASIETLQKSLFAIGQESKRLKEEQADLDKQNKELVASQELLIRTGQRNSAAFEENRVKLEGVRKAQEGVFLSQKDLAIQQSKVNTEYNQTVKTFQTYMTVEGQLVSLTEKANAALSAEITTINSARKANSEILKVRSELNPKIAEEAALIKALNQQYDANTTYIKQNVSAAEKQKMAIGDYKNQIIEAAQELNIFNGGFIGFIGRAQEAGGVLPLVSTGLKSMIVGIKGITTASLTFLATPIGAVIGALGLALGAVITYFKSTQEGIDAVTSVTRPLQAIFNALVGVVQNIGKYLVGAFTSPKKALIDLYEFVKQNLINRFTAFGEILQGIMDLDFKRVANGVLQFGTGVENMTDKIGAAAKASGKFLDDAIKRGQEIDRLNKKIEKSQLDFERNQIKYNDAIDEQLKISKDTGNSLKEREAASREIIRINQKMGDEEAAIIENKIKLFNKEHEGRAILREDEKELIELEKELDEAQDRGLQSQLEQSRIIGAARKEAAAKAKEDAKNALDSQLKAMDVELQTYLANEGIKKKSYADTIRIAQEVRDKELKKLEVERKNGLKNQKEYELAKLEIANDYLKTATDASIENLDLELEAFKLTNQRKVDEARYFSDELYYIELDRIQRVADAETNALKTRLEKGVINQQEYDLAIKQLEKQTQEERDSAFAEREAAQKTKETSDLQIQRELDHTNLDYDLQAQLAAYDAGYEARKALAIKNGTDLTLFDKQEAQNRIDIEKRVQNNKMQLASNTLGNLAAVLGEESKAGKAAAIAQTTIDTYKSATSAYSSLSGIPVVGPALGAIAAAAAVAAGLANVKKITATKTPTMSGNTPSYARGVIGLDGAGTGTSDSIRANLSNGESVLTAQATSMFPNTLSAMNVLGGGDGIDSNSNVQNGLMRDAFGSNGMADMIAEAVAVGAEMGTRQGSQRGMRELADDRTVMNNAKF